MTDKKPKDNVLIFFRSVSIIAFVGAFGAFVDLQVLKSEVRLDKVSVAKDLKHQKELLGNQIDTQETDIKEIKEDIGAIKTMIQNLGRRNP